MKISNEGLNLIKDFEGLRTKAYLCPAGVPTLGYGSTGPDIKIGMQWTSEQCEARLRSDVAKFEAGVSRLVDGTPTTQGQFDALCSLSFNIGLAALKTSTLLRLHKMGMPSEAARQFRRWDRGGGRVLPGLTRRREAEAKLYGGRK